MGKVKIYYRPQVVTYVNHLVLSLYEAEYFGFMEDALNYKNKLIDFIEENISSFPFKNTPLNISHFGSYYMFYNSNMRTTWYIFFEKKNDSYLITYISNNHQPLSQYL